MGKILLKKLLNKMDFAPVLNEILRSVAGSIIIEDTDGRALLTGFDGADQSYQISCDCGRRDYRMGKGK